MKEQLRLLNDEPQGAFREACSGLSVRESSRARHLILQSVPPNGIEIVVPRGSRLKDVAAFVEEHREWIERVRREIADRFRGDRSEFPERIELAALTAYYEVEYRHFAQGKAVLRDRGHSIRISSPDPHFSDALALLRAWLLRQASKRLKPWLMDEARRVGEQPNRIRVALQSTRWGSCSSARNINLNACLLFLDPALVRYLMVHELCHLKHLNHSKAYWRTVERFEPDWRRLDRRLTESWSELPWWVLRARRPRAGR